VNWVILHEFGTSQPKRFLEGDQIMWEDNKQRSKEHDIAVEKVLEHLTNGVVI